MCYSYRLTQSLMRLLQALHEHEVDVYLVCNREPTADEISEFSPYVVSLYKRANHGWDWAAYKEVWQLVSGDERVRNAPLILANDSVYYLPATREIVNSLLSSPADVCGQTVNKEFVLHAQAWLLRLSSEVVASGQVSRFFQTYRITYGKIHSIKKGELKLSASLRKAGYSVEGVLTGPALWQVASEYPERVWAPELLGAGADIALSAQLMESWSALPERDQRTILLQRMGVLMETRNPTAHLALTLTRCFGAPLKLDLLKWPFYSGSSASISAALKGYVPEDDLRQIEQWFNRSPSYTSTDGLERLFFNYGIR